MAGQLHEHPLAELIREISAAGLSGALRLSRERAKIAVYFDTGELIFAGSNLRTYRLYECMRRWGLLEEQHVARARQSASDLEFGSRLVEIGTLSRGALNDLMARQVSEILCHILLWRDGEWDFDPRVSLSEDIRVQVKTLELLMESARRVPSELAASRFRFTYEKISPVEPAPDYLNLLPTEAFVLTRVDRPTTLNELVAISGLPENEALGVVYALALGGFLLREAWPQALGEGEVSRARAVDAKRAKPVKVEVKESSSPAAHKRAIPPPEKSVDDKAEVEALFARLNISTNYYQILGVTRPVNDADIKSAYHALARRFHPDRFRKFVGDELHTRVESAFAQIAQAYETLKTRQSRASYDSQLMKRDDTSRTGETGRPASRDSSHPAKSTDASNARPSPPPREFVAAPTPEQAEQIFQQGLSALQSGNQTLALSCLSEAAQLVPSQPRYRAYYGRALAGEQRMHRNAEAEIKAAIALDASNSTYRVMLAELYIEIGLLRRAENELKRALSSDPRNETARRLLNKLK